MPTVIPQPTQREINAIFNDLHAINDKQAVYLSECVFLALSQFSAVVRVGLVDSIRLIRLFDLFRWREHITKTLFFASIGLSGSRQTRLKPPFTTWFIYSHPAGYRLTADGLQGLTLWVTTLRRVLQEREEYYKLKFGRFTPEARQARINAQPFYRDLTEAQRIAILREYYALPYKTTEDKRIRILKRKELSTLYGLRSWDVVNAIRKYGELVKSVRNRPDIAHLFR